jgi:parvulin-like peptidyl-prolyl isomerase
MAAVIQVTDVWQNVIKRLEKVHKNEILSTLKQYGVYSQLIREMVIEEAIANFTVSDEETMQLCKNFYQENQLNSEEELQVWLKSRGFRREDFNNFLTRNIRVENFKKSTWGYEVESYFRQRKAKLDRVVYSLIRVKDIGIAQELYFRIQEGEQSFSELASVHSEGQESHTGGLLGPMELGVPHPALGNILATAQPGQLLPPTRLDEWFLIIRLEKLIPALLDEATRQRLFNELFEAWVQNQVKSCLANIN